MLQFDIFETMSTYKMNCYILKTLFKAKINKIEIRIIVTFVEHLVCVRYCLSLHLSHHTLTATPVIRQSYVSCWSNKVTLTSHTFLRYSPLLENTVFQSITDVHRV